MSPSNNNEPIAEGAGVGTVGKIVVVLLLIAFFFGGFGFGYLAGWRANDDDDDFSATSTPPTPPAPGATPMPPANPDAAPSALKILHINDHHSHIDESSFDFDVSALTLAARTDAGVQPSTAEITYGGFPRLISLFKSLSAGSDSVVKLHAGDALTGTIYYSLFQGKSDASLMNEICFDAFTVGNHEFDNGDATLAAFIDDLMTGACQTPVLGANIVPHALSDLIGVLAPYTIKTYGPNGEFKVGIVGVDVAQKTKLSSSPDPDTQLLGEIVTAQKYIDELLEMGVTKIIVMSHFGFNNEKDMAQKLRGVDVVVGGDSHTLLGSAEFEKFGWSRADDYPVRLTNADGNTVCVVQAFEFSALVGELNVQFDANGDVVACTGSPQVPIADVAAFDFDSDTKNEFSAADSQVISSAVTGLGFAKVTAADPTALGVREAFRADVEKLELEVIGSASETLCLERIPGQGRSNEASCKAGTSTYLRGGDIQMIVAAAFLNASKTADISIQNAGGVRIDIPEGNISYKVAAETLPFSNTLVVLTLTGQSVHDVLEDALDNALVGSSSGAYPYAFGLRFHVDGSAAKGSRVVDLEVNRRMEGDWAPIDLAATYKVSTNDYIAGGKDGYFSFEDSTETVNTYIEYMQGLIEYIKTVTIVDKLPESQYSTKSFVDVTGCNHSEIATCGQ
ncbi:putative 5prime-nucleotidase [Diplonema papillatum]|nr:putative 5prime-nucleotidase [Diplonema papillatum]|eukprot:gene21387-32891_t